MNKNKSIGPPEDGRKNPKKIRKSQRPVKRRLILDPTENDFEDEDDEESDVACLYCNNLYKHSKANGS